MQVAGRDAGEKLDELWPEIESRVRAEAGLGLESEEFDGPGLSNVRWTDEAVVLQVHADLPRHALAFTAASALERVRQRLDQYPEVRLAEDAPAGFGAVRQALRELVLGSASQQQLVPLGLDSSWEMEQRELAIAEILEDVPPEMQQEGSVAFLFVALQFARFAMQHPPRLWGALEPRMRSGLGSASELGDRLFDIAQAAGCDSAESCVTALTEIRDAMGLDDVLRIEDRRSGALI
jgi:hypothetical protein